MEVIHKEGEAGVMSDEGMYAKPLLEVVPNVIKYVKG